MSPAAALGGGEPRSLRSRLLLGILGGVLALWLATLLAVWIGARHELEELLDGHLAQAAALIAAHDGEGADAGAFPLAPRLDSEAKRVLWQVWRGEELLHRSSGAPLQAFGTRKRGYGTQDLEGRAWRVFSSGPLRDGRHVRIAERVSDRREILVAVSMNQFWPMLLALPLLALVVLLAVRSSLEPLLRIGADLDAREPLATGPLPEHATPAEIRPLVSAINRMLARTARAIAQEKQFTSDAAHELRTPIAALRAQAQVAIGSNSEQERMQAMDATLAACDRAARLIEQLLTLARLDAREATPVQGDADLEALARGVMAQLADMSPERGDDLELRSTGPARVRGEPTLIEVLVRNLVGNALRYSHPGARVLVSIDGPAGASRLSVEDGGAGLEPQAIARLGERFFRAAPEGPEGTGLGWSIVRRIAALHEARVEVDRAPELGGLRVRVTFPPSAPTP